ncbi:alpha/beta fold hydrolase [Paenibacillus flagellatus]|uniref:Alpha/beta hydrolase n=1 Tax=Paenibacillus flagellatus TaxID=2211139 RepID=A0A2V5KW09_9BACL|nr:alpha/beta hydrolase [Paenibacillus flagellatus]PYI53806.1 alpha/beta hydrolase [Paenibacillus flagellatus]
MDLYYETQGEGKPVVLIHSPGVDSREWTFVVPHLAAAHKVVTYDGRGTGRSPAPQRPTNLLDDLRSLLDELGLASASLVGHSMGGQLAAEFALAHPERVDKLALIAPSLSGFAYSKTFTDWMNQVNSYAPDVRRMVDFSLSGPLYRTIMQSPHRDLMQTLHSEYMNRVFTEWKSFEVVWPTPPAIERLERIEADTLFVRGTVEWDDMDRVAEEYRRIPSIRFEVVDGADHMLTITHGERLADLLVRFLDG